MKNYSLIITILFVTLFSHDSTAQWLTNGNTSVAGDFIGTLNPIAFNVHTDNTFRYGITAAGRFGINTSSNTPMFWYV